MHVIVLSFILVLVAAVTLIVGFFQDTLAWIYVSIGACVAAMVFLAIGWMQRRSATAPSAAETGYGPGATTAPTARPATTPAATRGETAAPTGRKDVKVVPKKSTGEAAAPAASEGATTVVRKKATASTTAEAEPQEPAAEKTAKKKATKKKATAKKTTKKAPAKKAAKKKAAKKKAAKKKAPAKKAAGGKTTGKAAREALGSVKGLGPAKVDALLKEFGSLEDIKGASESDLAKVKGVGDTLAKQIQKAL
ncbi:MAG: hypothetical protein KY469_03785 [Actinobacteria bacterium]|nr:hypothetical protein [Actinomycetota bacterium]